MASGYRSGISRDGAGVEPDPRALEEYTVSSPQFHLREIRVGSISK